MTFYSRWHFNQEWRSIGANTVGQMKVRLEQMRVRLGQIKVRVVGQIFY